MVQTPRSPARPTLAVAAVIVCVALTAPVAASPIVSLDDPAHDDHGPGHYVHPSGADFRPGQFDLRRLEVVPAGPDHFEIRVTLRTAVREPLEPRVSGAGTIALKNGIFVQNVDVYIDAWPGGYTEGVPGRRVSFAPEHAWDLAVVMTPQPYRVRAMMEDWGLPGTQVYVPADVRHEGATLIARVPTARLGSMPEPDWGWAATVSGARWDHSFRIMDRMRDQHALDAATLPVHTVAEDAAFGGGTVGGRHPQVIDIFVPPGVTQSAALGGDFEKGSAANAVLARVPMVYPNGGGPKGVASAATTMNDAPAAAAVELPPARIRDVLDATLVITGVPAEQIPYRLGEVLDSTGRRVGKVVLTRITPEFATATVVEGLDAIAAGMAVRFPKPEESKE